MNLLKYKKAQMSNYLAVVIFLAVFGFLSMLGYLIYSSMVAQFTASGYYVGQVAETGARFLSAFLLFDKIIALIMVVLIVGVAVSSFKIRTRPVFMVISFILIPIMGLVAFFFNYIFIQLISNTAFTSILAFFPITILICTNLHWVAIVCAIVGSIALYAKREQPPEIIG